MPWTAEQVLSLAPDQAAATAASGQAVARRWAAAGASDAAVWGLCQGSGKKPYEVCVELAGPAYRCSCPSRKVPCKHALGLLLMWSAGGVVAGAEPDWVRAWLADRAARAERAAGEPGERDEAAGGGGDTARAARRAVGAGQAQQRRARRAERVAAGVAELEGWLTDQVRRGLGTLERGGSAEFAAAAARMVDAQAPGLASGLRRAGDIAGRGRDWPGRVLEELAQLHLLVSAHARLDELPAGLAATVRTRLGYTTEVADVVATGERVADRWLVLGVVDQVDEWLVTRRVWLRGLETGRAALVLSFAAPGRQLDNSLVPGFEVPGELAFYPAAQPLRAVVASRTEATVAGRPGGDLVAAALAGFAEALAADPWLERWPLLLGAVTPRPLRPAGGRGVGPAPNRPATVDAGWCLVDVDGDALPLRVGADPWPLLAVSGGGPLTVAGEWSRAGLLPLSCWDGERPVRL